MQQTISENVIINLSDTLNISCIFSGDSAFLQILFFHLNDSNSYFLRNNSTSNKESLSNSVESGINTQKVYNLNPFFITGFFDAESSFMLSLIKDSKYKIG
jgi:hypothetical protein